MRAISLHIESASYSMKNDIEPRRLSTKGELLSLLLFVIQPLSVCC